MQLLHSSDASEIPTESVFRLYSITLGCSHRCSLAPVRITNPPLLRNSLYMVTFQFLFGNEMPWYLVFIKVVRHDVISFLNSFADRRLLQLLKTLSGVSPTVVIAQFSASYRFQCSLNRMIITVCHPLPPLWWRIHRMYVPGLRLFPECNLAVVRIAFAYNTVQGKRGNFPRSGASEK